MSALARWCYRHRWVVVAVWAIALIGSFALGRAVGTNFSTKFQLPNTQSAQALNLLKKDFPAASGSSDQIVVEATSGSVTSPRVEATVTAMLDKVASEPHVRFVTSPYSPRGASQVSRDGRIAFATVAFDGQPSQNPKSAVRAVIATARSAAGPGLRVALSGQDIANAQSQGASSSTGLGIVFALIVLGLAFGALFAAVLPILTALFAIGVGYEVTGLLSHVFPVASFATVLGVLIGLGVGVDYALFIVTRHRAALKAGHDVESSVVGAVNTAGRAVFFAGLTVCIALLGQFVLGLSFLYGLAVCCSVTVLLTMTASLTLLPAMLAIMGTKVLSRRQRGRLRRNGPEVEHAGGFWFRWASFIDAHPRVPAVASLVLLVAVALPVFTLRLGLDDASTDPPGSTTLAAYHMLSRGFGPGFSGPFELVSQLPRPGDTAPFQAVLKAVAGEPGVASVSPARLNPAHDVAVAMMYPTTSPQAARTTVLLDHLRSQVIPHAEAGSGVRVLVGGTTAIQTDFAHVLSSKLVLFMAVVVVLGFLLLMAVFRSLLVPLVASVMNVLSVGAALGIMNAVFEWGWGHSLFRIPTTAPVEVFVPVMMMSILFGLSMDYEVFLVSRMREEWVRRRDPREAVVVGQAATGRVITAAAAIMILVFGSFALGQDIIIKQFGIGLAGAILVDAFVVRTVLVPAVMHLFGRANWWLPGWLDRILPHLNVEGLEPDGEDDRPLTPPAEPALVTP